MTASAAPAGGDTRSSSITPWPLAGTADFARTDGTWRERLATTLAADLRRHVIDAWFPRSVDTDAGGFWSEFDRRWRRRRPAERILEFQARQTRTAARIGLAFSDDARWKEIALHGLRYLKDTMHDQVEGGWFCRVDHAGRPMLGGSKHAHGIAYLIGAALAVHRLTGSSDALDMAREAFDWLEAKHHDSAHGGYHGWVSRAGRPILLAADVPTSKGGGLEPLGHEIGLKDANVHSDLLEALYLLVDALPDPTLVQRLRELYGLITERFGNSHGSLSYVLYPDLTPVPGVERYGYPMQSARHLPYAAQRLGIPAADGQARARAFADHVLERAWDPKRGGLIEAGPATEPYHLAGQSLRVRIRPWWVQTEALQVTLFQALVDARPEHYRRWFERILGVVNSGFVDHRYGGWYVVAPGDLAPWTRLLRFGAVRKGDMWKDASHEADFYLTAVRMLRGFEMYAPIG